LIEINAAASLACAGRGQDAATLPVLQSEEVDAKWDAAFANACVLADSEPRTAARLAQLSTDLRSSLMESKGTAPAKMAGNLALPRLLRGVLLARARHSKAAERTLKDVEQSRPVDASLPGLASLARARAAHYGAVLPARAAAAAVRQARTLTSQKVAARLTPG